MSRARVALVTVVLVCMSLGLPVRSAEHALIPAGSIWKYNDSGVDLGTAWRAPAFNDAAWFSGPAQLGYGDGGEATVLSYGGNASNKRITYYFRKSFDVANPAAFSALTLRFVRDDGIVIYVNGVEVHRANMPGGTISAGTLAPVAISGTDEEVFQQVSLAPSVLVNGANVIAVEIHQQSVTSTDIGFDLELRATDSTAAAPAATLTMPADGSTLNTGAVTFAAEVTAAAGLQSATLYVGGPPQTVAFSGAAQVQDAQITADTPTTPNGGGLSINVDGLTPHAHGLLKIPSLIGGGAGQVPAGANVVTATLRLNCTNQGQALSVLRLTEAWTEDEATWNQRAFGVNWSSPGADGAGSNAQVPTVADCTTTGLRSVDLTRIVQEWSDGAPNHGVVIIEGGTDGIDFSSSESGTSPSLTVTYRSGQTPMATQPLAGTNASVQFPINLAIGATYFWNVKVIDSLGRSGWAPADFSVTLDAAAPNAPVLVSPANGATGVSTSPTLAVNVSNPNGGSLTTTMSIRKAAAPAFTIIAMPDTQHYSEAFPEIFTAQTQWIAANTQARNIVFVTHEGDVVQNQSNTTEWQRANTSMSILDGVVPYGIGPGNHDLPTTNFNIYFPFTRYQGQPWYGGHMGTTNDNNFQLFSAGGVDFVIVHLAFCPSTAALQWADGVLKSYPNRVGIMTTHGYLDAAAQRTVHVCGSTQYIWDMLAVPNPNLRFMFSGHVHAETRRSDSVNGRVVHQVLADYQDRSSGGQGWLRIMKFVPAEDKIYVQTYSPWLNAFETDADSEFTLDFAMGGGFTNVGTTTAPSGSTASMIAAGLDPNTEYEWRAVVTNSAGKSVTGPTWKFTTGATANQPPVANGDSYTVQAGSTLNVAAPGVLGNDTDVDGPPLHAQLVSNVSHGTLSITDSGAFTYTPAAGYSGPDAFTYRASDGFASSPDATVSITVTPAPPPGPIFTANFNAGQDSFTYADDVFRGTSQPSFAAGSRVSSGGFTGGALRVLIGGVNKNAVTNGMSGGWRRTFTLAAATSVALVLRYNLTQSGDYEATDLSEVLASIDGALVPGGTFIRQVAGNGNGGPSITTGWVQIEIPLGTLAAGSHTVTIGGYNNRKDSKSEQTTILIDDVSVIVK